MTEDLTARAERLRKLREELDHLIGSLKDGGIPTQNPPPTNTSHPAPPQYVVDAYLHQIAVDRWRTTERPFFAVYVGFTLFNLAHNTFNVRMRNENKQHPLKATVNYGIMFASLAYYVWRMFKPPPVGRTPL